MSNLRAPVKIFFSNLKKANYSSSNEKVGQELLQELAAVNKSNSEKLYSLLPYLQRKNIEYISPTSTTDTPDKIKDSDQVQAEASIEIIAPCEIGRVCSEPVVSEKSPSPPQSLPVMAVANIKNTTVDLTHSGLPLSLHLKDNKSLLVDAVVKDFKHIYFKMSSAMDGWYLVARTQGKTLYVSMEEFFKRPGAVQYFLRKSFTNNAVAIYDPKQAALVQASIIDKLKALIETLIKKIKSFFAGEGKKLEKDAKKIEEKVEQDLKNIGKTAKEKAEDLLKKGGK